MQNKLILMAVAAALSTSAFAAPTLAELADADAQLKMAELQAKVTEAKAKADQAAHPAFGSAGSASGSFNSNPILPSTQVANTVLAGVSDDNEEVHLEAIYGVGGVLKADVSYNGSSTTMSMAPDGVKKVGPWTLHEISPFRVVLTRAAKKKGDKQAEKEMFVSSSTETSDKSEKLNLNTSPTTGIPSIPGVPMSMPGAGSPALPPVPTGPQMRAPGMPSANTAGVRQ
jgi:hypothetical protein